MTDHPGDNANNRFRAFWAGLLGFVSFGIILFLALKGFGPGEAGDSGSEFQLTAVDKKVIEARKANLADVQAAQAAASSAEALNGSLEKATAALASKKAGKTELVVPNSPTFIKQMVEAQQAQPVPEAEAAGAAEGEPKN